MVAMPGKALYVDGDGQFTVRSDLEPHKNGEGELLIETLFSGINPADTKHSRILGIRSTVIGYDFCGRVLSSPAGSSFGEGDIVAGFTPTGLGRPTKFGTHQNVLVCPEDMAFKVPPNMSPSHAAGLSVVTITAAEALYNMFDKPLPSSNPSDGLDKSPLLIWGAASSVGVCAVQFARASGVQNILVTASPARHDQLRALGATQCFDYASPTVVEDIRAAVEALGQGPIAHALDAVGNMATSPTSAELVARCAPEPVASLACVTFQSDKRFRIVFAAAKDDVLFHLAGMPEPMRAPAKPIEYRRSWEALQWAVKNYGSGFVLPAVHIVEGSAEEALVEIKKVGNLGRGFGKTVIQHPIK